MKFPSPYGEVGFDPSCPLTARTNPWFPSPYGEVGFDLKKFIINVHVVRVSVPLRGSWF